MRNNWNPYTADEPDPWPEMRERAIEVQAEALMNDEGWIEATLLAGFSLRVLLVREDGGLGESKLVAAIAAAYKPGVSHALIGGLLLDILWDKAYKEAEEWVDDGGDYDGD
jgi:hypothetical protein